MLHQHFLRFMPLWLTKIWIIIVSFLYSGNSQSFTDLSLITKVELGSVSIGIKVWAPRLSFQRLYLVMHTLRVNTTKQARQLWVTTFMPFLYYVPISSYLRKSSLDKEWSQAQIFRDTDIIAKECSQKVSRACIPRSGMYCSRCPYLHEGLGEIGSKTDLYNQTIQCLVSGVTTQRGWSSMH